MDVRLLYRRVLLGRRCAAVGSTSAVGFDMGFEVPVPTQRNIRGRIAELDGWRGVSILCVIVAHLVNVRYATAPETQPVNFFSVAARWGVDIFFIISGFIITRQALAERDERLGFSTWRFYARRVRRIIPAFYLYLLVILALTRSGVIEGTDSGPAHGAAFVCDMAECGWSVGHSWTLAYEEQFYLIFPLVLYLSGRRFPIVMPALLIALLTFPFLRFALHLDGAWWRMAARFCGNFAFIAIGVTAAAHETTLQRLAAGRFGVPISVGCAAILIVLAISIAGMTIALGSPAAYIEAGATLILLPPSLAWIALSTIYRDGFVPALLCSRFLQFFGLISYSLYIWQQVFTAPAGFYLVDSWLGVPALMLIAAVLSYYGVERPCLRLGRRFLAPRRTVMTSVGAGEEAAAD
jgi:peptidoglycan/LPS O-acetylase OafA/YrhL